MKIQSKIHSEFIGEINGIKIYNSKNYSITLEFMKNICRKFKNLELKSDFIEDFALIIDCFIEDYNIGKKIEECIKKAKKFEELQITIVEDEEDKPGFNRFEYFNEKIKFGDYIFSTSNY